MLRNRVLGSLVTLVCLVSACRDAASPGEQQPADVVGVYTLKSIAGAPVPAPYSPDLNFPNRMMSGSLILLEDGTGTWSSVIETAVGGPTQSLEQGLTWVLDGFLEVSQIAITLACDDLGSCIAGPHLQGTRDIHSLTISGSSVFRTPVVFEPQPIEGGSGGARR